MIGKLHSHGLRRSGGHKVYETTTMNFELDQKAAASPVASLAGTPLDLPLRAFPERIS